MKPEKNSFFPDDSAVVKGARLAVDLELKKKQALSQPIAHFDQDTGKICIYDSCGWNADFRRKPVAERTIQ